MLYFTAVDSEALRTQFLEIYFTKLGLTKPVADQLESVLEKQFQSINNVEISGSIFYRDNALQFDVISSSRIEEVQQALELFLQGNDSKIEQLYQFSYEALREHTKYHGEKEMLKVVHYFFEVFRNKSPAQRQEVSFDKRKNWAETYQEIVLGNYSNFSLKELKVEEKGFMGLFHVHDYGTPPSPLDLAENLKINIPSVVIASTIDYKVSETTLYLISKGEYKQLYQGLLQPKQ